jgi:alkanesulfonate monooxygenase SsuD/methylene tetrahydromethanopterin reductase-like flavin-dependent oxidoreductase (luciferase family)
MKIGIGLPNVVKNTPGKRILEWARAAEEAGFAGLATIGRVAYPGYEELIALSAAAAVTERVDLFTDILLGSTRTPVQLAKEAASLDQISGGRFVLGLGAGAREDDFHATGHPFKQRGRRMDHAMEVMHRAWKGELVEGALNPVSPRPVNGESVPIIVGGASDAALERMARWGIGWTMGGGGPEQFVEAREKVEAAWKKAGRTGNPALRVLCYFALGADADTSAEQSLGDYYGREGWAKDMWKGIPRTAADARARAAAFAEAGVDELYFIPVASTLDQVELLAKAVL